SSNIAQLMQQTGLHDYQKLHQWSCEYYAGFWKKMINQLGIHFDQPFTDIIDLTNGIESPQWLKGAKFNIADSCFQAKPSDIAIIHQTEAGTLTQLSYGELDNLSNSIA